MSRFTHLIVHQRRSAPRRQVRPTSTARLGFTAKVFQVQKKKKNKRKKRSPRKHASTPANGVASSGIKKHTSTISWFVRSGGRRQGSGAERARPLESLSHVRLLHTRLGKPSEAGHAHTHTYTRNFFLHSLSGVFRQPEPRMTGLFLLRLGRSVGPGEFMHWPNPPASK